MRVAPLVLIAAAIAGLGRWLVTMVNCSENGAVRLMALRPNLELSRAKIVRSEAAIILRWVATTRALWFQMPASVMPAPPRMAMSAWI